MNDWPNFTSALGVGLCDIAEPDSWRVPGPLIESDPPEHDAIRAPLVRIISPKVVRGWRDMFQREADLLCDEVLQTGEIYVVPALAEAFVLNAFPKALGVDFDAEGRRNVLVVGNHNANALGPTNDLYYQSLAATEGG